MVRGIRARGSSIQIDFTYQGVRCRETLKIPPTKTNLKHAAQKKHAILYEIETGTFDYLKHFPGSTTAKRLQGTLAHHTSVEAALKEWLKLAEKRCARSTIRDYSSAIYYHLIPTFGGFSLDELKSTHVKEWLYNLDISNKRANNVLTPLRQMLEEAYADEVIDKNPLDRIRNLPRQTREPQPFTKSETQKILGELQGEARNLIQFAFATGLRTSELIALQWSDISDCGLRATIRRAVVRGVSKTTKTASGQRTVELQPQAQKALELQLSATGPVGLIFRDPRAPHGPLDDQKIRKRIWRPALERAQVPYREPYQTRHTFASAQLSDGKNPLWVASQMGHKDWGMIRKVYGRWIPT